MAPGEKTPPYVKSSGGNPPYIKLDGPELFHSKRLNLFNIYDIIYIRDEKKYSIKSIILRYIPSVH
jgi:hypothetical protein